MSQCAQLAEAAGADEETILAAFFHDIGHLCEFAFPDKTFQHMDSCGIVDHEKLGAAYLTSKGFSTRIANLVQSHVDAKRYLTYCDPTYYQLLSEASKKTLSYQGGPMEPEEAKMFKENILLNQMLAIRHWDDQAKCINFPLPDMQKYATMMVKHLSTQ